MSEQYPQWIDEYAAAIHHAMVNIVPGNFGPIDGAALMRQTHDAYLDKLHDAVTRAKEQGYTPADLVYTMRSTSVLRCELMFMMWGYIGLGGKRAEEMREVFEFFHEMLVSMVTGDIWAHAANLAHTSEEIEQIINEVDWQGGNEEAARVLGRVYNSVFSLSYALYRDFFPQQLVESYGPYDVSERFGENTILVIKDFRDMHPRELWPELEHVPYDHIRMYQVYEDVDFRCELIGMHAIYDGDLISSLRSWALYVDGEPMHDLESQKAFYESVAQTVTNQVRVYEEMSTEELKQKFIEWRCYQFKDFYEALGIDWQPSDKMREQARAAEVGDRFNLETFPDYDDFQTDPDYEVYWLKQVYGNTSPTVD